MSEEGFGVLIEIDVKATLVDVTVDAQLRPIAQEVADELKMVIAALTV